MNIQKPEKGEVVRMGKFGAVGLLGVGVNMGLYALFWDLMEIGDFIARALAIEISILHNFAWNFAWTWKDRGTEPQRIPSRLLKYHGSTLFSSFGVTLAVGWLVLLVLPDSDLFRYTSHLVGIGAGMVSNYLLADLWVFEKTKKSTE